jgi:hypothetical protein
MVAGMAPGLRRIARLLRLVAVCLVVLGPWSAPSGAVRWVDGVAWTARATRDAAPAADGSATHETVDRGSSAPTRAISPAETVTSGAGAAAPRPPAAARSLVVERRLYLLHAAILC